MPGLQPRRIHEHSKVQTKIHEPRSPIVFDQVDQQSQRDNDSGSPYLFAWFTGRPPVYARRQGKELKAKRVGMFEQLREINDLEIQLRKAIDHSQLIDHK